MRKKLIFILVSIIAVLVIFAIIHIAIAPSEIDFITDKCNDSIDIRDIDSLRNELTFAMKRKDEDLLLQLHMQIGNCYFKRFDYNNSLRYYLKACSFIDSKKQPELLADVYYKISLVNQEQGGYIKAYEYALKTDSIEKRENRNSAETLNLLGSIYEKTGLYVKSLATHFKSLELQKNGENKIGLANSYHNLAHIYMLGERFDKAFLYYSNALKIYEEFPVDEKMEIARIYISLGNYHSILNDPENAILYLEKAQLLVDKSEQTIELANVFSAYGNIYFRQKEFTKAKECYNKSLIISRKERCSPLLIANNLNLSKLLLVEDKVEPAIKVLTESLNLANEIGAKRQLAELAEILYFTYSSFPDSLDKVKEYATLFLQTKKYLPNENMQDSIIEMSVKHEVNLQKNEEIAIEKYKKNFNTVSLLSLLVIILFVSAFIYYRNREKQRRDYEKKLAKEQAIRYREVIDAIEKERKRIAVDLHDSLGQMLSTTKMYLSGLDEIEGLKNEGNQAMYNNTISLLDESCNELRNISYNIMPGTFIKFGLIAAIKELINKIGNGSKTKFFFQYNGYEKRLDEGLEIFVYRIIQECFNNIIKHAEAKHVNIEISLSNNMLNLLIKDDGKGMDVFEKYENKGLGWKSIVSRTKILDGKIKVDTKINRGTCIMLEIPV